MFIDRKPTRPNRYKITDENGAVQYVTLERADEPIEEGTPLNAAVLNGLMPKDFSLKDYNGDGVITVEDVSTFRDMVNAGTTTMEDDYNGDGIVNSADVDIYEQFVLKWGDKVPVPIGASVGQLLRIASVDSNGKVLSVRAFNDATLMATVEEV